jgi:catechol 2,3-dioxygenase-like lactoylglutathione lyase family enzyme
MHHVALSVTDMDKSIEFYNILGFNVVQRFHIDKFCADVAMLQLDSFKLELFAFKESKPLPSYRTDLKNDLEVIGTKHFALTVNDLEASINFLTESGINVDMEPILGASGFRYIFIKDPNGIFVEVIEAGFRKEA